MKALDKSTLTHKVGVENILRMRLPLNRFRNIPSHYTPPLDEKGRCQVALLAQVCKSNSFDGHETGLTDELHFWLSVGSSQTGASMTGVDMILPSGYWFSLASASTNAVAREHLHSFGLKPLGLEKIHLQEHGGSLVFPDGGWIEWTISGSSTRRLPRVGVNHTLFVTSDEPGDVGHQIAASLSNAAMDQPGKVRIQTNSLEPFLLEGERLAAAISRISKLEADVVWQHHSK